MNTVKLFYTDRKVKVTADNALIFRIACALEQRVYIEDCTLTCDNLEETLEVIRAQILINCDIDESAIERIGNITKMTVYCFE